MEAGSFNKYIFSRAGGEQEKEQKAVVRDMARRQLLCSLLLCVITQVCCQPCAGPCQCPPSMPRCPAGVPLVSDSCGCCRLCARQEGEACGPRRPCDASRGLQCDLSASFPGEPGQCVGGNQLGCELDGRRLEEGEVFQPSCAQLCHCLGGGVTCVPLCSQDLQRPAEGCPRPQLLRLPGRCCREWVCDGRDNSIVPNPPADELGGGLSGPSFGSISNCIHWSSDWSPCSRNCGPGVSTRSTNRNWACRLQTEARLCQVRPCQTLPGLRKLQPGPGGCESSYSSPLTDQLEHQGCRSTGAHRPRYCPPSCSPSLTRTVRMVFRCPQNRLTLQQVMVIESCSCSPSPCRRRPPHRRPRCPALAVSCI
ncbi:CCN family member 2 [Dissostichus eleginoides]|uniref:CCN family member 2 n=1 Tax=Dissostichus eleginoides TaxID=100907 RepID=A0AAD9CEP1_DISEL|nr:CCN family member 2 [Dissostichus eleginoides]